MPDLMPFRRALARVPRPDDAEFLYDEGTAQGGLRTANLDRYLELLSTIGPTTMLVAEAPGWRGATVTGVPFMSVRELTARPGPITGHPDGDGFTVPDAPAATWELSAAAVWRAVHAWQAPPPVFWPIYPNHPHLPGEVRTNRSPRPAEVRSGAPAALALLAALDIRRVVAVGRKAQGALALAGIEAHAVRHPAQGGARQFAEQMATLGRVP